MNKAKSILVGNTFPLTLVRRPVRIEPQSLEDLRVAAEGAGIRSFWGHENSRRAAEEFAGVPLLPETQRPSITLSPESFPQFGAGIFTECWVLSPVYAEPFRPAVGEEVAPESIRRWQILKITWE